MYEQDGAASSREHPAYGESMEDLEGENFDFENTEVGLDSHEAGSLQEAGLSEEAPFAGEFGLSEETGLSEESGESEESGPSEEFGLNEEAGLSEEDEEVPEIHETAEIQLASELLEVTNEEELDQFLGKLISRAGRSLKKRVSAATGNSLGGILKGLAKRALPMLGTAVGGPFGAIAANVAGNALGLELGGLSSEDRDYEMARSFVRFADNTAKRALSAASRGDPSPIRGAVTRAARRYAPGLLALTGPSDACGCSSSGVASGGVWYRRGSTIVLRPHRGS
jgi:hypothetical protein